MRCQLARKLEFFHVPSSSTKLIERAVLILQASYFMPLPDHLSDYKGVLLVSCSYVAVYYVFILFQVFSTYYCYFRAKANKKEDEKVSLTKHYYASKEPLKLTAGMSVCMSVYLYVCMYVCMYVSLTVS